MIRHAPSSSCLRSDILVAGRSNWRLNGSCCELIAFSSAHNSLCLLWAGRTIIIMLIILFAHGVRVDQFLGAPWPMGLGTKKHAKEGDNVLPLFPLIPSLPFTLSLVPCGQGCGALLHLHKSYGDWTRRKRNHQNKRRIREGD